MTNDECKPVAHPHSDRPNWRPEDDAPLRQQRLWPGGNKHPLDLTAILRTFKRVQLLANAISAEDLAKELMRHGVKPDDIGDYSYLEEVWERMNKEVPDNGEPFCQVCGRATYRDRRHAKYCSASCRQKAYRKRQITRRKRQAKRNETRFVTVRVSHCDEQNVTPTAQPRGSC
jgi:hypothetical protein